MNEVMKAILERRSVRKYKPDMVEKDLIDEVIQAGLYAVNGHARQSSVIIAVTNRELRDAIAEENRKIEGWKLLLFRDVLILNPQGAEGKMLSHRRKQGLPQNRVSRGRPIIH